MARKEIDSYEYKEAPMRKAFAYSSFGWLIGKHSQHYSKKYDQEVVTLRRDIAIGADPTIRECEKEYHKLEKGIVPAKYKNRSFIKFIFKALFVLITFALCVCAIGLTAVGVYDGVKVETRVRALYNTAVEKELFDGKLAGTENRNGSVLPDSYIKFVKNDPTLDTFAELVAFADGKVGDEALLETYSSWLVKYGSASDEAIETIEKIDPSVKADGDGRYITKNSTVDMIFDVVRKSLSFISFDNALEGMPIWVNSFVLAGGGALVLFVLLTIIGVVFRKRAKKERIRQCALLKKDCLQNAAKALHDLKMENRELMTRKDMRLLDLENMFTQVMSVKDDDDD